MGLRVIVSMLACGSIAACSSSGTPTPSGGSGDGGELGGAGSGGAEAGGTPGAAGDAGFTSSGAGGGSPSSGAGEGGGAGTVTRADDLTAVQQSCATAAKECSQVTTATCEDQNDGSILPVGSRCFQEQAQLLQCVAALPETAFQCFGTAAKPYSEYCSNETTTFDTCSAADAGT